MLDDFILEQKFIYQILVNSVKNNKVSHAFIIETNGYHKGLNLALAYAKYLFCPNNYTNNKNCKNCNQCKNIDNDEFIELKVINPEGQWIKKSELDELQNIFSRKSIVTNKKIYIINKAEKLNISSANSLLKFLEEPEEGIIAILITENISQLLPTIVSRCQVLSLKNKIDLSSLNLIEKIACIISDSDEEKSNLINDESFMDKIDKLIEFVKYYEENGVSTIIYINKLFNDYFKEKDELYFAFTVLILIYKDILNIKIGSKVEVFNDYVNVISNIAKKNNLNTLTSKINVIMELREKIKFNANANMLMDKLLIELERCDNYDRSSRSSF